MFAGKPVSLVSFPSKSDRPKLIVPTGTQVVTLVDIQDKEGHQVIPKGSVGVILTAPTDNFHSYRLRFPDGKEGNFLRRELAIRKHYQKEGLEIPDGLEDYELHRYVIYRCVVGSRAYGLEHGESDTDVRGIYLPPADFHWSLYGVPDQLENPGKEECFWELQKFLVLALKANPNILECLYTPLVERAAPLAQELLALRGIFLSRLVYQTYNGYVLSQFRKLEQDLRAKGAIKWKHAMHLVRLLLQGKSILAEGLVPVRVEAYRESLLEIRHGAWTWEKVDAWRRDLHKEFEAAFEKTSLPERPDYEKANAYLIHARRVMAEGGDGGPEIQPGIPGGIDPVEAERPGKGSHRAGTNRILREKVPRPIGSTQAGMGEEPSSGRADSR